MQSESLDQGLRTTIDRRRIVKTGAKLAYAAPLVAATFKLTADSALAVCQCFIGETYDPSVPACGGADGCCRCGCTVGTFTYDPATNTCIRLTCPVGAPNCTCTPTCTCCTQRQTL
jgi:hypothetical protein